MRLLVSGTVNSDSEFSTLTSIQGFQLESSVLYTFIGNLSDGIEGNIYDTGGADRENECYLPTGGSPSCTGITSITSDDSEATALLSNIATANSNLVGSQATLLNFSTIDPADTDITQ